MAREEGAPIDELLSEAMRSYARHRGAPTEDPQSARGHDYEAESGPDLARTNARPSVSPRPSSQRIPPPPGDAPARRSMPLPPPSRASVQRGQPLPPPPPARGARAPSGMTSPPMRGAGPAPSSRSIPPPPRSFPPPLPSSEPLLPGGATYGSARSRTATLLSLTYNGQSFEVAKERFILGRSKTQADLVLEDPNVSRQHAAIERSGDTWYLADLGSTNGCYIDGQRVSRRPIADGDVIEITTHQIRCTLR